MSTSTGYDSAAHTPVGASVTRVYFCEPGHGTAAADLLESETYGDALAAAIARHEEAQRKHDEHYADPRLGGNRPPLPERFAIDCRWTMKWPQDAAAGVYSSGVDTVMQRTTYDTLDEAREHLARLTDPHLQFVPRLRDGSEYRP